MPLTNHVLFKQEVKKIDREPTPIGQNTPQPAKSSNNPNRINVHKNQILKRLKNIKEHGKYKPVIEGEEGQTPQKKKNKDKKKKKR